jgi:hypothetical protein
MAVRDHAPVKTCAAKSRKREERREGIQKIATPSQLFIFFVSFFIDIPRFLVLRARFFRAETQSRREEKRARHESDRWTRIGIKESGDNPWLRPPSDNTPTLLIDLQKKS